VGCVGQATNRRLCTLGFERLLRARAVVEALAHVAQRDLRPALEAAHELDAPQRRSGIQEALGALEVAAALLGQAPVGLHAGHGGQVVDRLGAGQRLADELASTRDVATAHLEQPQRHRAHQDRPLLTQLAPQLERRAQVDAAAVEVALRAGQAAHVVEGERLARAVLEGAEALQGLGERGRRTVEIAGRARGPGQVVERVADGLGAGEAMKREDRLLEVKARTALRPVRQQAQAEGHHLEERRVIVGQALEQRERLADHGAGALAVGAVPRRHGRGVRGRGQQARVIEAAGEGDRVGEQRLGARGAPDRLLEHRVLVEGGGGRVLVAELAIVGDGLLHAHEIDLGLAAAQGEPRARQQCLHAQRGALGSGDQRGLQPPVALGEVAAVQPEAPQRGGQAQGGLGIAAQREGQSRAQIVVLGLQRAQRAASAGRERVVLLGQGQAPVEVAHGHGVVLGGVVQALGCVLADGVEQAKAPAGDADERLVDQAREEVDDLAARDGSARTHVLRRLEREAAGEDRQAPEEHALLAGEQVVAPLDGGAQRLLARARRAAAGGEDVEAVAQPRRDLVQRQRCHARRGKLDGQRHAVQAPADLLDRLLVLLARAEVRVGGGALDEQPARLGQRGHAPGHLALAVQRLAARGQDAHARSGTQEVLGQARARVDHVLAVVEHDDRLAPREVRGERLLRRALGRDRGADGQGRGLGHEPTVREARELDEPDAVGNGLDARQRLDGQARLAAAARADQREHPHAIE